MISLCASPKVRAVAASRTSRESAWRFSSYHD
jgi:hypothetical protein